MKNKTTKLLSLILLGGFSAFAQNNVAIEANTSFLNDFANNEKIFSEKRYNEAVFEVQKRGLPVTGVKENGSFFEVVSYDPISGTIFYNETKNNSTNGGSIQTIKVNYLHNLNIKGQGMLLGEWDGSVARSTHNAFGNRIQVRNTPGQVTNNGDLHATHVAGTMIASETAGESNKVGQAKGMAPMGTLASWNWTSDLSEMAAAAGSSNPISVSNHSYGPDSEALKNAIGLRIFGRYTGTLSKNTYGFQTSRDYDLIANNAPYYTIVFAAGNDRDASPALNGTFGGRDLLVNSGVAKNNIVVAAINGINNYSGPGVVTMSTFSNWGPTDDFRIKPDISAKGVSVYSTAASNDDAYSTLQGTSMAAPAVSGAISLWQQYFKQLKGKSMLSSTVRALMAHTAMEAGAQVGPDYMYGWGVFNAEGGAVVLENEAQDKSVVEEQNLDSGKVIVKTFTKTEVSDLTATIAWNDPAGEETSNTTVNYFAKALVNDLDLRIVNTDTNVEYLPYRLKNSWSAMQDGSSNEQGDNVVDNIEKIFIPSAPAGNYKLTISHKGALQGGRQVYSLILTGHGGRLSIEDKVFNEMKVYPNPIQDVLVLEGDNSVLVGSNVVVYDSTGRIVLSKEIVNDADLRLNTSNLTKGFYILTIDKKGASKSFKLIK